MPGPSVGELLREWRNRRGRSQLRLALEVGVSPRHISFVETGRSRPSASLLLALGEHLEVPLREQNAMLLAAGYAPRYPDRPLSDPAAAPVRAAIQRMLDAHEPYPGVVVDRRWDVTLSNRAARRIVAGLPPEVVGPPLNVYRVCLHPQGLAPRTLNLEEWAAYLLHRLRRSIAVTGDPALERILAEVAAYPSVAALRERPTASREDPSIVVPLRLTTNDAQLSLLTTLTTFGTPRDVTVDELAVELFFPADEATAAALRAAR